MIYGGRIERLWSKCEGAADKAVVKLGSGMKPVTCGREASVTWNDVSLMVGVKDC